MRNLLCACCTPLIAIKTNSNFCGVIGGDLIKKGQFLLSKVSRRFERVFMFVWKGVIYVGKVDYGVGRVGL